MKSVLWVRVGDRSLEFTLRNCQQEFVYLCEVVAEYLADFNNLDETQTTKTHLSSLNKKVHLWNLFHNIVKHNLSSSVAKTSTFSGRDFGGGLRRSAWPIPKLSVSMNPLHTKICKYRFKDTGMVNLWQALQQKKRTFLTDSLVIRVSNIIIAKRIDVFE